jgi:hypothetical protein
LFFIFTMFYHRKWWTWWFYIQTWWHLSIKSWCPWGFNQQTMVISWCQGAMSEGPGCRDWFREFSSWHPSQLSVISWYGIP